MSAVIAVTIVVGLVFVLISQRHRLTKISASPKGFVVEFDPPENRHLGD